VQDSGGPGGLFEPLKPKKVKNDKKISFKKVKNDKKYSFKEM